jgi:hypothetical protein
VILKIIIGLSEFFAFLSTVTGLFFLLNVKTDVGIICSVLALQCGWIILLLAQIAGNTRRPQSFP